jgi:hypothetical protein
LQKVKWLLRAEKAGHTGTLDPLASGVLPLCFGAATKFSQLQLEADKTYAAIARLGQTTTTADAEGEVLRERASIWRHHARAPGAVQAQFTGDIQQVPPMHSAEEGRQGLVRIRPRGRGGGAPGARCHDSCIESGAGAGRSAIRPSNESDLQQGHLHPHPGRGHRRGLGCGAHLRAAPHRHRRLDVRAA